MKLFCLPVLFAIGVVCSAGSGEGLPELRVPYASQAPVIDGESLELEWRDAAVIRGLQPARGCDYQAMVDREPTEIRLLWDSGFLYVSFICFDQDIVADPALGRDGDIYEADACELFLDVAGNGREWFEIQISPLNQVMDTVSFFSGGSAGYTDTLRLRPELMEEAYRTTRDWDAAGMRSAAGRLVRNGRTVGWCVELALPAGAVSAASWHAGSMRMNFVRYNHGRTMADAEKRFSNWSPVQHGCPHISPAAMGRVELLAAP